MGYIYVITNLINEKIYIGQTTRSICKRFDEHIYSAKHRESYLYRSMRKYGVQNFNIDVIEECNAENLDQKEIYWIQYYNSTDPHVGYNIREGGRNKSAIYYQHDTDMIAFLWCMNYSLSDIANVIGCSRSFVSMSLKNDGMYDEHEVRSLGAKQWVENFRIIDEKFGSYYDTQTRSVAQYNMDGEYIQAYPSIKVAAEMTNSDVTSITKCCSGNQKTANTYQWRYDEDPPPVPYQRYKKVCQYNLDGSMIETFDSMEDAQNQTGVDSASIGRCIKGEQKTAGKYMWGYAGDPPPTFSGQLKGYAKPVEQYTIHDEYIATYSSVAEASKATGVSACGISWCCTGRCKTSYGYKWKYIA